MKHITHAILGLAGLGSTAGAIVFSPSLLAHFDIANAFVMLALIVVAGACLVSFVLSPTARQVLALCLISAGIAIFAAEFAISPPPKPYLVDGGAGGASGRQALLDLRAGSDPAYVSLLHSDITIRDSLGHLQSVLTINGTPVLPLSGVARTKTLLCNETGEWVSYMSDQFGFRNPEGSWSGSPDIVTVGDSFTQGNCVVDGKSYVDRLRTAFPKTLNLGQRGNGPFAILASIREYLPELRPALTIWFHYEGNDVPSDLMRERQTPIFQRYLEPEFTQGLRGKAGALSTAFAAFVDQRLATASAVATSDARRNAGWRANLKSRLTLYRIRNRLGFANFPGAAMIDLYRTVLARAKMDVAGWDGELLLVYLPTKRRFTSSGERRKLNRFRRKTITVAQSVNIEVLDLTPVFEALPQPELQYHEHLTEAGHALVAREVERYLRTR